MTHPDAHDARGWHPRLWAGAAGLLALPLVAMQFSDEVRWSGGDFVFAAAMLAAACGAYELGARLSARTSYRAAVAVAVLASFALVWINLAVGIIGGEHNPANLMFFGVVALALAGALVARGRPRGMAVAMAATAAAMAAVAVIILGAGWNAEAWVLSACFVVPWLVAAALFRHAALSSPSAAPRSPAP
ncbi:MAG TPA: hypothetical protein VM845_10560 [Burkholderiaceae bacterium]|jgi:hypothetical protein|nr:hypothetical protein [Burkholderiaceae bacterium]